MENVLDRLKVGVQWGPGGHQLIAQAAEGLLSKEAAKTVKKMLQPLGNIGLRNVATWADIIKNSIPKDQDSKDFIKAFPDRGRDWHFVDMPLQAKGYDRVLYPKFTRDNDVVQMINHSINVLQKKEKIMSELNALRWITHLVGDIHQPLHVGSGYIDTTGAKLKLTGDPDYIEAHNLSSDHGGNAIILSKQSEKELNLHSYWDGMLGFKDIDAIGHDEQPLSEEDKQIVAYLIDSIKDNRDKTLHDESNAASPISAWAASWASESISRAREAYMSIVIKEKISETKFRVEWEGKESYEKRCLPIVRKQIQLASQRLADLLNQIFK